MNVLISGGPIMFFILVCSIAAMFIFISKIMHFHRAQIDTQEFISGLRNELKARRVTEAISICEQTPGPVANMLKTGIINHDRSTDVIKGAMEKVALQEIPRLESGISLLASIAVVAPLFGLLGTVLGLINVFQVIATSSGMITGMELANGIWIALLTTAFGLAVAIPVYIAYNYLVTRTKRNIQIMEQSANELVGILAEYFPA